ncbi:unnamed protein product [Amoebophrya sp. A25]|nr:unnamed protein product [Amoebophrya sp. A25]|eukprot:GSA25T00004271001.1
MLHCWRGYKQRGWGHDDVTPLSGRGTDWIGWAVDIIESLDTLHLMGLHKEWREGVSFLENEFSEGKFARDQRKGPQTTFEIVIRALGGLMSAADLAEGDVLANGKAHEIEMKEDALPYVNWRPDEFHAEDEQEENHDDELQELLESGSTTLSGGAGSTLKKHAKANQAKTSRESVATQQCKREVVSSIGNLRRLAVDLGERLQRAWKRSDQLLPEKAVTLYDGRTLEEGACLAEVASLQIEFRSLNFSVNSWEHESFLQQRMPSASAATRLSLLQGTTRAGHRRVFADEPLPVVHHKKVVASADEDNIRGIPHQAGGLQKERRSMVRSEKDQQHASSMIMATESESYMGNQEGHATTRSSRFRRRFSDETGAHLRVPSAARLAEQRGDDIIRVILASPATPRRRNRYLESSRDRRSYAFRKAVGEAAKKMVNAVGLRVDGVASLDEESDKGDGPGLVGAEVWYDAEEDQMRFSGSASMSGRTDSYYEYLLKLWIQSGKKDAQLLAAFRHAMRDMRDRLVRYGVTPVRQETAADGQEVEEEENDEVEARQDTFAVEEKKLSPVKLRGEQQRQKQVVALVRKRTSRKWKRRVSHYRSRSSMHTAMAKAGHVLLARLQPLRLDHQPTDNCLVNKRNRAERCRGLSRFLLCRTQKQRNERQWHCAENCSRAKQLSSAAKHVPEENLSPRWTI